LVFWRQFSNPAKIGVGLMCLSDAAFALLALG
jgi:hypothetical protein